MEAHLFNEQMTANFFSLIKDLGDNGFQIKVVDNPVHKYICYVFAEKN